MLAALPGRGLHCREAGLFEVAAALRAVELLKLLLLARDGLDVRFRLVDLQLAPLVLLLSGALLTPSCSMCCCSCSARASALATRSSCWCFCSQSRSTVAIMVTELPHSYVRSGTGCPRSSVSWPTPARPTRRALPRGTCTEYAGGFDLHLLGERVVEGLLVVVEDAEHHGLEFFGLFGGEKGHCVHHKLSAM